MADRCIHPGYHKLNSITISVLFITLNHHITTLCSQIIQGLCLTVILLVISFIIPCHVGLMSTSSQYEKNSRSAITKNSTLYTTFLTEKGSEYSGLYFLKDNAFKGKFNSVFCSILSFEMQTENERICLFLFITNMQWAFYRGFSLFLGIYFRPEACVSEYTSPQKMSDVQILIMSSITDLSVSIRLLQFGFMSIYL